MSRYFAALEAFKKERHDEVIKYWKSDEAFDNMLKKFRKNEKQMARDAIKAYGSVDRFTDEMIANLGNFSAVMDGLMAGGKPDEQ